MRKIKIQLQSDLCAGNGESMGYSIDSTICMDSYGFPFIPAKRILGCLREAAMKLQEYGSTEATGENIADVFGHENGKEGLLCLDNAVLSNIESMHNYILKLKSEERKRDYLIQQSTTEKIIRKYTTVRGQTKIDSTGKAQEGSLRFIRVLNQYDPFSKKPLEFFATMDDSKLTEEQKQLVEYSCLTLRHIGMNRNRGLGNIQLFLEEEESKKSFEHSKWLDQSTRGCPQVVLNYEVYLDSPITIQEYLENGSQIKARTMIGIFSNFYLRNHSADETFEDLFLNGTVKWSALTPVINGNPSVQIPAMIMKLKNGGGKLINTFTQEDDAWKKQKPKSLDGSFLSYDSNKQTAYISQPETENSYHNRIHGVSNTTIDKKTGLYMQESLKQGMLYAGTILFPKELKNQIKELFSIDRLRLGRSKKTQYGNATIQKAVLSDAKDEKFVLEKDEPVFAILKSDLTLLEGAVFQTDEKSIRHAIAERSGLLNEIPEDFHDICRYRILTGFHSMWHLQKPKIKAVMGGSIYCFSGKKDSEYHSQIILGEYQQEGMGMIELIPLTKLKKLNRLNYGEISVKKLENNSKVQKQWEEALLLEAALQELKERAFVFKRENSRDINFRKVPVRRLRLMLTEAMDISDLWTHVSSIKTSDVSSESAGRKVEAEKLLKGFYGIDNQNQKISLKNILMTPELINELEESEHNAVKEQVLKYWKEPLFTLLHMLHYQKSGGN